MIRNISYNNDRIKEEIDSLVGSSFSFKERWRMKSIGTPSMQITSCSPEIHELLEKDNNRPVCNAELRPKGIILRFRSRLETYGLIIPFYRLSFYQNGTEWSFHGEGRFIKTMPLQSGKGLQRFKQNLLNLKGSAEQRIEDL